MADRRFALINKDISSAQIEDALNEDLTITGDWTFSGSNIFTNGSRPITLESAAPKLRFVETDATANEGIWDIVAAGDQLLFRLRNDAESAGLDWLSVSRTGISAPIVDFGGVIRLPAGADASASSTGHSFQIGSDGSSNLIIDDNEIVSRNNGATTTLFLGGGDLVSIGGDLNVDGDITLGANFIGVPSVTSGSELASGVYTPTLTNSTNVAGSTAFQCQWMRVGNCVTVSGRVNIDPTAAGTLTILTMTTPVAATFAAVESCCGTGVSTNAPAGAPATAADCCTIRAATSTNEIRIDWFPTTTANTGFQFICMYEI